MSFIRTQKRENPFVQVDKHVLENDNLSFTAKGLMAYILSKPDDWTIRKVDLIKRSKDGKTKIETALLELMANGYLNWYQIREEDGTMGDWVYDVYERPEFNPEADKWIKDGLERLNKRATKTKERNKARLVGKTPKADNQPSAPKADNPLSDNPLSDNQPFSNNELELNNYFSNKEEEEEAHRLIVSFFEKNIADTNEIVNAAFTEWLKLLPVEIIKSEIEYAAKKNAKSFSYLEVALQQDLDLKIDSVEKLEQKRTEHANKKKPSNRFNKPKKNENVPEWFEKHKRDREQGITEENQVSPEYELMKEKLLESLGVAKNS